MKVVTWAFKPDRNVFDRVHQAWYVEQSRHRICYEFAEHGDLGGLVKWYAKHG